MCSGPSYTPPPPPPAAPPVLDQLAPKSAGAGESASSRKAKGLSRYKLAEGATAGVAKTNQLGGIPTKTGANK